MQCSHTAPPCASLQLASSRSLVALFATLAGAQDQSRIRRDLRSRRRLLLVSSTGTTTGMGVPFMPRFAGQGGAVYR